MDFLIDPFMDSEKYFKTTLQQYQFFNTYSRFDYSKGRRETWKETVQRAVDYLKWLSQDGLSERDYNEIYDAILRMDVMPSMRLLAMAGEAAKRSPQSIFNCAYTVIDDLMSFVEILNISMNGIGVGFSVEKRYVDKLPVVATQSNKTSVFIVPDSTDGWCKALEIGIKAWFNGEDVIFNYDEIREAGKPLKIKGGRASGYKPLKELLEFTKKIVLSKQGQKLSSLDCYDIVCKIGDCVIMGGHRRTAFLCLFDYNDELLLQAKSFEQLQLNPHRYNSNNSRVIEGELSQKEIVQLVMDMDKDGNGEPGIFSRYAARLTIPERREDVDFGLNPCGEIFLRPKQFCNLSSVICRESDDLLTLLHKVKIATMIGTIQAMASDYNGLSKTWQQNQIEERLLGVDLNGQMDCEVVRNANVQCMLKDMAVKTNVLYAEKLGINAAKAVTTVKPSGNSGVLLNVSSGIHPRWSQYYIRNVRVSKTSPLYKVLQKSGVSLHPENGQTMDNATTFVVSFPMKSPDNAVLRKDVTALKQLDYWQIVKENWTEHNPSTSVYYTANEILDVANWLYTHQNIIGGLTFFPKFDANYAQAPYIEIAQSEYERLIAEFPKIDFSLLQQFEDEDLTEAAMEVACTSGACDFKL